MTLDEIAVKIDQLGTTLNTLVQMRTIKDYYSTSELAVLLGRAEFTIRNHCRLGRIRAERKKSGRGKYTAYAISHEEFLRLQKEGLLPIEATTTTFDDTSYKKNGRACNGRL